MIKTIKTVKNFSYKDFGIMILMIFAFTLISTKTILAETCDITLTQYHSDAESAYRTSGLVNSYFETIYPRDGRVDYKKFMKYTYKISDDSVVGLKANTDLKAVGIFVADVKGDVILAEPYNMVVYALAPGKAILSVYDGSKLIDKFNITVKADTAISPSSYVDLTRDKEGDSISYSDKKGTHITKAQYKKENDLIKKFAKTAADSKNTTTNQRVFAAINAVINNGGSEITEKQYNQFEYDAWKKGITLSGKYRTAFSALIEKKALYQGFSTVHHAVLSNLGFECIEYDNSNSVLMFHEYAENDGYRTETVTGNLNYVNFSAVKKLETEYDFKSEDPQSPYRKTHLPAWLVGQDTKRQVVSVGKTVQLPASDLNNNIFSTDPSVVTAKDGKLTGVKPGVAIVYRYNDNYCDIFYVLVKDSGTAKTIKSKVYTKTTKSYFNDSDYAPFIKGGQEDMGGNQLKDWEEMRIYEMEPIFGKGSLLTTKYSKGQIECYITTDGESELYYTVGTGY